MKKTPFVLVFTSLLSKILWKKHLYLLQIFKIHIFCSTFCSFMFLHLLLLKWSCFNITQKLRKRLLLLLFSQCLCQKLYEKTTFFNQIYKVYVICTILQTFRIWIFTLLKSRPFQCNGKFKSKTSFIVVLTWLLSNILCKNYLFLDKFSTSVLKCTI